MSGTVDSELVAKFMEITGADSASAHFFLDMSKGNLDQAVTSFLDTDGAVDVPRPEERTPAPQPASRAPRDHAPVSAARPGAPVGQTSAPKRIVGLGDVSQPQGKDSKYNELYTGGAGQSGIAVQGRPEEDEEDEDEDEVSRLFKHAKARGARAGTAEDLEGQRQQAFTGRAHTLAGASRETHAPPPDVKRYSVTFYANGVFTVNDGPPRQVEDPVNLGFITAISRGMRPAELKPDFEGQEVEVSLLRKMEDYEPPREPVSYFTGQGKKLGGESEEASRPAPTPVAQGEWEGPDESQPTTSVTIRLADGSRQVARFNLTNTVGDIRRFLQAARPEIGSSYRLMVQDMPPRRLDDNSKTIEEERLQNACIMQR